MNKFFTAALSFSLLAATSAPAFADTYAVVINALDEPINLGGAKIMPQEAAWTPLDATIVLPNGSFGNIRDSNLRSRNNRRQWLIQGFATLPTIAPVNLRVGEVGCIAAVVNDVGTDAFSLYKIDMQQMDHGRCRDNWWQNTGKDDISLVVNWIQTGQKNAIEALALLAK